jgi:hypothetical protein
MRISTVTGINLRWAVRERSAQGTPWCSLVSAWFRRLYYVQNIGKHLPTLDGYPLCPHPRAILN